MEPVDAVVCMQKPPGQPCPSSQIACRGDIDNTGVGACFAEIRRHVRRIRIVRLIGSPGKLWPRARAQRSRAETYQPSVPPIRSRCRSQSQDRQELPADRGASLRTADRRQRIPWRERQIVMQSWARTTIRRSQISFRTQTKSEWFCGPVPVPRCLKLPTMGADPAKTASGRADAQTRRRRRADARHRIGPGSTGAGQWKGGRSAVPLRIMSETDSRAVADKLTVLLCARHAGTQPQNAEPAA